jgi:hypothetical protein
MPPKHDLRCPWCNEDWRYVECGDVTCFCNMCGKTFIRREVRPKTDLGGVLMSDDDG